MKSSTILSLLGFTAVILVIGMALGSIIFPTTKTETTTQSISITNAKGGLYQLRFDQSGPCSPPLYFIPWSVTLNNGLTIVEPPQSNLSECCYGDRSYTNYSSIVFSVPSGNYSFAVNGPSFSPQSGNVTVNRKDVTIVLKVELASCGSRTISSANATLTVSQQAVIGPLAVVTEYQYGTLCSGVYGTVSVGITTITTEYGDARTTSTNYTAVTTITLTEQPSTVSTTLSLTSTLSINSTTSACPTIA